MTKTSDIPDFDAFPHRTVMPLRFSDTDQQGHVNNVVFATAYETGRVEFFYSAENRLPPQGTQFVIAKLDIAFVGEMHYPGDIIIGTAVTRIGKSSIELLQALQMNGEIASTAQSIIVLTDPKTRRSTPLPDLARETIAGIMLEQT